MESGTCQIKASPYALTNKRGVGFLETSFEQFPSINFDLGCIFTVPLFVLRQEALEAALGVGLIGGHHTGRNDLGLQNGLVEEPKLRIKSEGTARARARAAQVPL